MRNNKTHNYTQDSWGRDFILEPIGAGIKNYMTGQGGGIQQGDYIILQSGRNSTQYQVEEIGYYSDPPDVWVALLVKVSI